MNIIILTSKDHLYANFILNRLFASGVFNNHTLTVVEQDWIIPGRSTFSSLVRYFKKCGFCYIFGQALKQKLFVLLRTLVLLRGTVSSPVYPYYHLPKTTLTRTSKHSFRSGKTLDWIRNLSPDLILSIYSKELLPEKVLGFPRIGCVNVHPAPLPAYKGVSPTFWCLAEGAVFGGATLHWMEKEIDTGEIIGRILVPLRGIKTEHELYMRCSEGAIQLILAFLRNPVIKKNSGSSQPDMLPLQECYRSLPTRDAIRCFRKRNYSFFTLKELLSLLDPQKQPI